MSLVDSAPGDAIISVEAHTAAMQRIDTLLATDPVPGTPEFVELTRLSTNAEAYEKARFPLIFPRPAKVG